MPPSTLLSTIAGDAATAALFADDAELAALLRVEVALAEASAEAGVIPAEAARRIGEVCAAFTPDWADLAVGFAQDGLVIPALVRQLRAAVGDPHRAAVHKGSTSQDIIDTGLVLRLGAAIGILEGRIAAVLDSLDRLAARDGRTGLMAHTRMQVALPFTAADKITTWSDPLRRNLRRLDELKPRLLVVQVGGPIGTRSELGPHAATIADGMADRLGLGRASPWHAQRDGLVEFGSWLSLVSGALGKIGQDVALLAQTEVKAVGLGKTGGSSAMPHKQNPVVAEVLVALARYNAGAAGTLHQALVHEYERSGAAWTLEWLVLPDMVVTTAAGLRLTLDLFETLRFVA